MTMDAMPKTLEFSKVTGLAANSNIKLLTSLSIREIIGGIILSVLAHPKVRATCKAMFLNTQMENSRNQEPHPSIWIFLFNIGKLEAFSTCSTQNGCSFR